MSEGILNRLAAAGAELSSPTCGPCFGGIAQLTAGERRISTSTRNDPGRMGSAQAEIYLASAVTVAASAVQGSIADPRKLLGGG
jgi:3-isopropylmalate/(R)-2-methylmalate dehydratase large subunit